MRSKSVVLLAVLSSAPVLAQVVPETIVVTATRTPQPLNRVGQSISVIDSAEIDRRQTATVVDLLRTVPGVTVTRNGGIGGTTGVFIRGAETDQTVTLIDGVKINDPAAPGGGFNFGNLLTGNISRIEVLRSAQSVLWGSQAIGGVVNIITRPPTEAIAANLRGEYGFRNTAQVVGNVSGKAGPLSASVGAGYFRTDGISAFSEARGGKERDGYENFGANAKLSLAITDAISIDARGYYSDGKVDIDGFAPPSFAFGDTLETTDTREFVGYTGVNAAFFDGRFHNRLGFAYTDTRRRNRDGSFESFAGDGRNERIEYQGIFDISDGWQVTGGLERETSRYTTTSFGSTTNGRAQIDSVYGQVVATPVTGLSLTAGVRHDDHDRFGGATTFGASGVWIPGDFGTTVRASYAEGFKAPSLYQLQGDYGNQTLRPERSKGWDAGVTQRLIEGTLQATATYFHRNSTDLIDFISCSRPLTGICVNRPFGTYDNVLKARSQGIEIGLVLQPVEALRVQANYTYTDARNRAAGSANFDKQLARRARHAVNTLVDYTWGFGLATGATLTHVGTSFDNAANSRRLPGYVLVDLRASFPITRNVEIYGRIENLFDEQYETTFRFGQIGRAGYAGVRLKY
ncbi:MAG: TonB-dependent receptor [Sandarakinorhabdus sp.]|nr:TonB-dependent receptor [Sandarakinorhabdus sp.]